MINLIFTHKFDHEQAVIVATKYAHLDLLKLIYQTKLPDFPFAHFSFQDKKTMKDVLKLASKNRHHHIMKWLADVGIIDNWLLPRKIYQSEIDQELFHKIAKHAANYACDMGDLSLVQTLVHNNSLHIHYGWWCKIVSRAFSGGHIDVLNWMVDMIKYLPKGNILTEDEDEDEDYELDTTVTLPADTDPLLVNSLLDWFWKNYDQFPQYLKLDCRYICAYGQSELLDQIYAKWPRMLDLTVVSYYGNLTALQWLQQKNRAGFHSKIYDIVKNAIEQDNLPILTWLALKNNPPMDRQPFVISSAVAQGNQRILTWWHTNGFKIRCERRDIYRAATAGYIHVLDWLRDHNLLPKGWDEKILLGAVQGGQINILKWLGKTTITTLRQHTKYEAVCVAVRYGKLDVLVLFYQYGLVKEIVKMVPSLFPPMTQQWFGGDIYSFYVWLKEINIDTNPSHFLNMAIIRHKWHTVELILYCHPEFDCKELPCYTRKIWNQYLKFRSMRDLEKIDK